MEISLSMSWPLLWTVVALIFVREIWNMLYFKRRGIPGPTPLPFLGNTLELAKGLHQSMTKYSKKYDDVCGIFLFRRPAFLVFDIEVIKQIMVKDFTNFVDRAPDVLKVSPFDKMITQLKGDHWRNVRNLLSPTFTASKMKMMSSLVNECCDKLVHNIGKLQAENNQLIECFSTFGRFSMDGIARCAFGLQVDSQNNPDDPFVENARQLINGFAAINTNATNPLLVLAAVFPAFRNVLNFLDYKGFPRKFLDFFTSVINETLSLKRSTQSGQHRKDFLQLLQDVLNNNDVEIGPTTKTEDLHDMVDEHHGMTEYFVSKTRAKANMTRDEILAQALVFFLGGYETTSTLLGFVAYSLATNPAAQEKLIEEIDELTPTRDSVDYTSVAKMPYLDGVICETLRVYPPAPAVDRLCNETFTCNGWTIPKGSQVFIPIYVIHHSEKYWPNPDRFDPTRFSKENREGRHPLAWMPFGAGPRNCIGMRFALMESKMAVVRLLQNYRFEVAPETTIPIKLGTTLVKPPEGVLLRVSARK
ncbi:cytochrome P450 3A7-like [Diadema antillarum]|uniref:cytochrome P450 3A7-like n=1 Tax=Diadema antillarum TaxID=105358 RepID=UPI003A8A1DD8